MQKDRPEGIADFMRDPGGEAAQDGEMLHPLRLAFHTLALGYFMAEGRDVLHREQDELDTIEAARVQQDRARANPFKVMAHLIVVEDRLLRQNLFQQRMQRGNVPLPIAEVIDVFADGLRRAHLKQVIEGGIGGLHAEVGCEDE
jgi:hypothetical protein